MSKKKIPVVSPPTQPIDQVQTVNSVESEVFNTPEAAVYLHNQPGTLETWRWKGCGPMFCKIGKSVRYLRRHLDAYLTENVFSSTTEANAAAALRIKEGRMSCKKVKSTYGGGVR